MKKIFYILIFTICYKNSFTQIVLDHQVIGSSGSIMNSGSIHVSSNVGETIISTFAQPNLIVTQGFEQPSSDAEATAISIIQQNSLDISVYPNPTKDKIILSFLVESQMELEIALFNSEGQQIVSTKKINIHDNYKQEISFKDFSAGNYLIVVKSLDNKFYQSFKIQKVD